MRIIIAGIVAVLAAGCASTPKEPVTRVVKIDSSNIAEAQAAGYKVVDQDGQEMLCRKELITGSHARYRTSCLTPAEWKMLADNQREEMQNMARRTMPPQGK